LISEGFPFPEIEDDHINFNKEDEPFLAYDFDINEEHLYRGSMIRMEQVIFELLGKTWVPMEKGFYLVFDENYSKGVPKKWYVKSKIENANMEIDNEGSINGQKDTFNTYSNGDNHVAPPERSTYQQEVYEEKTAESADESPQETTDDDTGLPDTYSNIDLPDTYG